MDSFNVYSHTQPTIYHITGGFKRHPIHLTYQVTTLTPNPTPNPNPTQHKDISSNDTNEPVLDSLIQYLKKIMLHTDYTRRTVYFRPDYDNCVQVDESTWRIPMIVRPPSEYPDYVSSILPTFESYPESYKQRIRTSCIRTWEENAFESIEYNACDILIRRI